MVMLMSKFIIQTSDAGVRLDLYLTKVLATSRHQIVKQIKDGGILVNEELKKAGYIIKTDDNIIQYIEYSR